MKIREVKKFFCDKKMRLVREWTWGVFFISKKLFYLADVHKIIIIYI